MVKDLIRVKLFDELGQVSAWSLSMSVGGI